MTYRTMPYLIGEGCRMNWKLDLEDVKGLIALSSFKIGFTLGISIMLVIVLVALLLMVWRGE